MGQAGSGSSCPWATPSRVGAIGDEVGGAALEDDAAVVTGAGTEVDDPVRVVVQAAAAALQEWGFGMASVRFICGTQELHKRLEAGLSDFLQMPDTILYSSCFDANGGIFEVLFDAQDAIISDELNHASVIDGIRLSKAKRFRYQNADMTDLAAQLDAASGGGARRIVVVTDGVFSMNGYRAGGWA